MASSRPAATNAPAATRQVQAAFQARVAAMASPSASRRLRAAFEAAPRQLGRRPTAMGDGQS